MLNAQAKSGHENLSQSISFKSIYLYPVHQNIIFVVEEIKRLKTMVLFVK
jgi:hypothetical protein